MKKKGNLLLVVGEDTGNYWVRYDNVLKKIYKL